MIKAKQTLFLVFS